LPARAISGYAAPQLDSLAGQDHDAGSPEPGAIMDIVVWLRSLGLGKYEAAFSENDIDETVLPSLTHENLKELGVTSFGRQSYGYRPGAPIGTAAFDFLSGTQCRGAPLAV
jgi:hypothetical protein